MKSFFAQNRIYAVVGATDTTSKFGYKVLKWYTDHHLPVIPVNPQEKTILGLKSVKSVTAIDVPEGHDLVLSFVCPPPATKKVLEQLKQVRGQVASVWLQPGTYDEETLDFARQQGPQVITDCILVNGERAMSEAKL